MRPGPPGGAARARVRGGIAPSVLLDVQSPSGEVFYWSDRPLKNVPAVITADGLPASVDYTPWLLSSAKLTFNRTMQTDTGSVTVQNISGDVLQRDFERIVRRGTLEGSLFVLRYYSVDLEWPWIEQHGTLTVGDTSGTVTLNLQQLFSGSDDTPVQSVSETCQLNWKEARCSATGATECLYTFASCQVVERFTGVQTAFEVNNPESTASVLTQTINRKRGW